MQLNVMTRQSTAEPSDLFTAFDSYLENYDFGKVSYLTTGTLWSNS